MLWYVACIEGTCLIFAYFMKSSIAEDLSGLETIGVINMGQYSGSKVKCSVLGH